LPIEPDEPLLLLRPKQVPKLRQQPRVRRRILVHSLFLSAIVAVAVGPARALADPVPLATSPYNFPQVTTDGQGTTINVAPPPSGLYYRATLDPTHTYRLTIMGQNVNGNFVLRLNEDGSLTYLAAPNGPAVYRVTGVTSFEALIYQDSPGQYLVRSITLQDCQNVCQTDSDLKAEITSALPELGIALQTHDYYSAAEMLLRWASPRVVWASGVPAPIDTAGLTASEIYYDYFKPGYGGVYCSGAADFFHKILDLYSIPNFELDFGTTTDDLTHATIVVPTTDSNGNIAYWLLDPTFNLVLNLVNSGEPASVPVALELWRAGLASRVVFDTASLGAREIIYDPMGNGNYVEDRCSAIGGSLSPPPLTAGCSLDDSMSIWGPDLQQDGFQTGPPAFLQLLGTTSLFTPDAFGVPQALQTMLSTFKTAVATGDQSVHIATPPLPPVLTSAPSLAGAPILGSRLQATTGGWSAVDPITSTDYQWFSCTLAPTNCRPLPGADSSNYLVQPSDAGDQLHESVIAANSDGDSAPAATPATAPVTTQPTSALPVAAQPTASPPLAIQPSPPTEEPKLRPGNLTGRS
jgi:hypothetical protein